MAFTAGMRCFLIGILGSTAFLFSPFIVSGLVAIPNWSPAAAGLSITFELWGAALGSLSLLLQSRVRWLARAGLAVLLASNVSSAALLAISPEFIIPYTAIRFLAGWGGGMALAYTYVRLGQQRHADSWFGAFLAWTLLTSGLCFFVLPWAIAAIGLQGLFLLWALLALALLAWSGTATASEEVESAPAQAVQHAGTPITPVLLAIFALFGAQGAAWTFAEQIASVSGISPSLLGAIFATACFMGLVGSLGCASQGTRFGRRLPFAAALSCSTILLFQVSPQIDVTRFAVAICGLQMLWCYAIPFLMGELSSRLADKKGMAAGVFTQLTGLGLGPLIVSTSLSNGFGLYTVAWIAVAFTVLSLIVALCTMRGVNSASVIQRS